MRRAGIDQGRVWYAVMIAAWLSLPPLAWLQYQWIGRISQAERERLQADLDTSVSRFVADFDSQVERLNRAMLSGPVGPAGTEFGDLPARYARLAEIDVDERLVRNVYVTRGGPDGTEEFFRFDPASGQLINAEWPASLQQFRPSVAELSGALDQFGRGAAPRGAGNRGPQGPGDRGPQVPFDRIDDQIPALLSPWWRMPPPGAVMRPMPAEGFPRPSFGGWLIVELDLDHIRNQMLPALVQQHFSRAGQIEYDVRVVSAAQPGRIIYSSTPSLPADAFDAAEAEATFLQLRRGPPGGLPPGGSPAGPPSASPGMRSGGSPPRDMQEPPRTMPVPRGGWVLQVVHRGGSLDALVLQTRRRNLAVSLGVLAVLAVSLAVLLVSTRRAQRLAMLQMDFVAGVSHELRTPLSVIRSAGENLADGLVAGDKQVRRYGGVIREEGRRLSQMVEQILGFAGTQSGRVSYEFQPVEVRDVVTKALAACEPEIRASGCAVETEIPPDLPMVAADETSLAHSVRNLIDNAVTHGAEGRWVGIRAQLVGTGKPQVEIRVEDRGRGIDPQDARRLFDPFYRGARSVKDQIRGFGLGLTLARRIVEAHGGTLWAEPVAGGGACFLMRLPAIPETAVSAGEGGAAGEQDDDKTDPARRG
jgi:signal transduction histidine kinase